MIHDRLQVSANGHLKEKEKKKEIQNNIYRNVQVSTRFFFLFQIVPLERNKTRLKLNQTLAKQKRSNETRKDIVMRNCKAISSFVYWSSNLSGGHR